MKPGIIINDDKITFNKFPIEEIGLACSCKSFELEIDRIKLVVLSPRLALDDETMFILLIDQNRKIYPMPENVVHEPEFYKFMEIFNLENKPSNTLLFTYDEHYGKIDKIIYPKTLHWKNLFKNDHKLLLRRILNPFIPKLFWGNFTKEANSVFLYNYQ